MFPKDRFWHIGITKQLNKANIHTVLVSDYIPTNDRGLLKSQTMHIQTLQPTNYWLTLFPNLSSRDSTERRHRSNGGFGSRTDSTDGPAKGPLSGVKRTKSA
jgi:hypothetical protein